MKQPGESGISFVLILILVHKMSIYAIIFRKISYPSFVFILTFCHLLSILLSWQQSRWKVIKMASAMSDEPITGGSRSSVRGGGLLLFFDEP